jgi:diacylglycerol kinase (ATP)
VTHGLRFAWFVEIRPGTNHCPLTSVPCSGSIPALVLSNSVTSHKKPDLIFVNPSAGGGHATLALPALRAYAIRAGWNADFQVTSSAQNLAERAHEAAADGHERIFILGGDGSFQDLVNALRDFPHVALGIIPAGCGNDLASALGFPRNPVRAAELLMDADVCMIDAVRVKTSDRKTRIFTGGGGVGLDAEACHIATTHHRNLSGRLRYLLSAARAYLGYRAIQIRIKMQSSDGTTQALSAKVLLLGVLNTPSYGAGLRFAPQAKIDDGVLDMVLVQDLPLHEILWALPRLIFRGEIRSRRVQRFDVQRVTIETDTPCRVHGDGEILGYTPVEIEIMPQAIRVLRPRSSLGHCV